MFGGETVDLTRGQLSLRRLRGAAVAGRRGGSDRFADPGNYSAHDLALGRADHFLIHQHFHPSEGRHDGRTIKRCV